MRRIIYLLESTELWGGTKVVFQHAELLYNAGYSVIIVSKTGYPDWYELKVPLIKVNNFSINEVPKADLTIATFWTTVRDAYKEGIKPLVHFCQGYEGSYREYKHLFTDIEKVYSLDIPKFVVSPHLSLLLKNLFNAKTYFIGQFIDRKIFYPSNNKNFSNVLNIIVIGPFEVDFKNISTALKGIAMAKHKIPLQLIRVSQFPISEQERKIIEPQLYYHYLPADKMGDIYRMADIFISVSKEAEGFGLPALEAMASGVPTILSKISSYLNFASSKDYALFIDPTPEAVSKAILKLYKDHSLREKLKKRGLEIASTYTKETLLSRLSAAIESIIENGT